MRLDLEIGELGTEQQAKLREKLRCDNSDLRNHLSRIAAAAYEDYLEMVQGVPLPSSAEEIRERRLLHLLKRYAPDGALLTESQIAGMFQMSTQEAARLLRNVRSHYHEELDVRVAAAVRAILESAIKTNGKFRIQVTSANLLDVLRSTVTSVAPDLDQIIKVRASAALYDIPPDTYIKLREAYDLDRD